MPDHPNLLDAIHQIVHGKIHRLPTPGRSGDNPLTSGVGLEFYVKDRLAGVPDGRPRDRTSLYPQAFSFIGGPKNPPDVMYRGGNSGDAFEVKKTQNVAGGDAIQLNSSPPKDRLLSTNPKIQRECRECEQWDERDFFIIVGCVPQASESLRWLWIFDARLAVPGPNIFEKSMDRLRAAIKSVPDYQFTEDTQEIGGVENVCGVQGVKMRLRGMWLMPSAWRLFAGVPGVRRGGEFCMHALMRTEKWMRYPQASRDRIARLTDPDFSVTTTPIPNPNGGEDIDATLVRWQFSP